MLTDSHIGWHRQVLRREMISLVDDDDAVAGLGENLSAHGAAATGANNDDVSVHDGGLRAGGISELHKLEFKRGPGLVVARVRGKFIDPVEVLIRQRPGHAGEGENRPRDRWP